MGVMRLAPLALLAACSSPASTSTTTHPGDDPPAIDAAPAVVMSAPLDAAPVDQGPCFEADGTSLDRVLDGAPVLCNQVGLADEDGADVQCYVVQRDGAMAPTTPSAEYPAAVIKYYVSSNAPTTTEALLCTSDDACTTLTPKLGKGDQVVDASLDATGTRVALSIRGASKDALEIWDAAKLNRIARAELLRGKREVADLDVAFLGDAMLVTRYDPKTGTSDGTWWRLTGKKLKQFATVTGDVVAWAMVGPAHAALAIDDSVAIYDVTTGKALGSATWTGALDREQLARRDDVELYLDLAGADDVVALLVLDEEARLWSAAVVSPMLGGDAQRIPLVMCPEGDEETPE